MDTLVTMLPIAFANALVETNNMLSIHPFLGDYRDSCVEQRVPCCASTTSCEGVAAMTDGSLFLGGRSRGPSSYLTTLL